MSRLFIDRLAHRAGEVPPKIVRRHLLWNTNPPASPPAHEAFFTTVVFENAAEVTAPPPNQAVQPGAREMATPAAGAQVSLDWYLSRSERDALRASIHTPAEGETEADRQARIRDLKEKVATTTGRDRIGWLLELERAQNYEQLLQLQKWWKNPNP